MGECEPRRAKRKVNGGCCFEGPQDLTSIAKWCSKGEKTIGRFLFLGVQSF